MESAMRLEEAEKLLHDSGDASSSSNGYTEDDKDDKDFEHDAAMLAEEADMINTPTGPYPPYQASLNAVADRARDALYSGYALASSHGVGNFTLPSPSAIPQALLLLLQLAFYSILPSFIVARMRRGRSMEEPNPKLYPSSHLDGLRGVASFSVFLGHLSYTCFTILPGFASITEPPGEDHNPNQPIPPSSTHMSPLRLPFIRLFYSGSSAVCVFFVISGYALSAKPMKQIHSGAYQALAETTSSAIFRRGFRLFLPCAMASLVTVLLIQTGPYEWTRAIATSDTYFPVFHEYHKIHRDDLYAQLADWFTGNSRFIWVWTFDIYGGSLDYDLHLWTIPVEFRASMVLFLTHIALCRVRPWARLVILAILCDFAIRWQRWEVVLFWGGAALAEYDLIRAARATRTSALGLLGREQSASEPGRRRIWPIFWACVGTLGLYLLSYPEQGAKTTPGFVTLESWVPKFFDQPYRYWQMWGGLLTVWAMNNLPAVADCFNGDLIQYLGNISYALYLMHGPVIHTFGYAIMARWWAITGTESQASYAVGFVLSALCIVPAVIWAADVFWRAVDVPVVRFSKWLEASLVTAMQQPAARPPVNARPL